MEYVTAAHSDAGISGRGNQDSYCLRGAQTVQGGAVLAVLCDGMGGLQKGELASAAAARAFGDWFVNRLPELLGRPDVLAAAREQWRTLLEQINLQLLEHSRRTGQAMGTTVTAMLLLGDRQLLGSLGDSRAYEHDGTVLRQLTRDHSLVAREVEQGRLSEEEARVHPQRNVLLQCLGAAEHAAPDFFEGRVRAGAVYLLCSDGFVHTFSREELSAALDPCRLPDRQAMTDALIRLTHDMEARGERDNITALLVRAGERARPEPVKRAGLAGLLDRLKGEKEALEPQRPFFQLTESVLCVHTEERLSSGML